MRLSWQNFPIHMWINNSETTTHMYFKWKVDYMDNEQLESGFLTVESRVYREAREAGKNDSYGNESKLEVSVWTHVSLNIDKYS